jgi:hypothetical protein
MAKQRVSHKLRNAIRATKAVLRVGEGRGFVVEAHRHRYVITAAHCLPHFPPCHAQSYLQERTYAKLIAPLGKKPTVWAECVFVDPIADIAVLGTPDSQELCEQADEWDALIDEGAATIVYRWSFTISAWPPWSVTRDTCVASVSRWPMAQSNRETLGARHFHLRRCRN